MQTIRRLLFVSRPISWINTAFPFAFGYYLMGGVIDAFFIIATAFFLIPYNLIMYGINDVYDYESDMKNPRKNSIEGALEAKQFHPVILQTSLMLGLLGSVIMIALAPNGQFVAWYLVSLFFVVAYSVKGLRFKEIAFVDSVTSSLHFTLPLVCAIAATSTDISQVWPYVVALFCWGMASHAFGAVQDIIPDRKGGLSSIATIIGARATVWFCYALYAIAAGVIIAHSTDILNSIVASVSILYIANIAPYHALNDENSSQSNAAWRRFIWLNYIAGAIITIAIIASIV